MIYNFFAVWLFSPCPWLASKFGKIFNFLLKLLSRIKTKCGRFFFNFFLAFSEYLNFTYLVARQSGKFKLDWGGWLVRLPSQLGRLIFDLGRQPNYLMVIARNCIKCHVLVTYSPHDDDVHDQNSYTYVAQWFQVAKNQPKINSLEANLRIFPSMCQQILYRFRIW